MDAVKYFQIKKRMTKGCSIECSQCELDAFNNGSELTCYGLEYEHPEKAVEIAEKWDKEHPPKTRAQVFFERFPDAQKHDDGRPRSCPMYCGLAENCPVIHDNKPLVYCKKCWAEPAPDKYQDWGDK